LKTSLTILREELLPEVNLEIYVVIVIPVLLPIDIIPNAEIECLGLEVGYIGQFDAKLKPVMANLGFPWSDFVMVLGTNFRRRLPIIKGESANHNLVKGQVGHIDRAYQRLLVWGHPHSFQSYRETLPDGSLGWEVVHHNFPFVWRCAHFGFITRLERIFNIAFIVVSGRGACTDSQGSIDL
jgi:hypothetical protein